MPADECTDCERHFPGGEGLIDGRCPPCHADFRDRRKVAKKAEKTPQGKGKEE